MDEFHVFGDLVASELSHLPDIHFARSLKAKIHFLISSARKHIEMQSQTYKLFLVPQEPKEIPSIESESKIGEVTQNE